MMLRIVSALLAAGAVHAEFLHVEVFIRDMSCEACTQTLVASFQKMKGVEHAATDFKEGTLLLDLGSGNRVGVDQVWDGIKRVGYTPGATKVTVRGVIKDGKLEVPEIGKTFEVEGVVISALDQTVELKGTTAPPTDPRTPVRIRVVGSGK